MKEQTEKLVQQAAKITFPSKVTDPVVLGFDGYIDNIISVVRVRHSDTNFELMEKISEWASRISQSAGSSASMEVISKRISIGGFTCNMGKALSTLCGRKQNIHLIGTFGYPDIKPIFQEHLINLFNCVPFSVSNPGLTDAYEFKDGKIMMVNFETINRLDWAQITTNLSENFLIDEYNTSQLWGIGYWASSPHMSQIFSKLQEEILPNLSQSNRKKYLLIDPSDLQKRPESQIQELIKLLQKFEEFVQVVLSLNDHELKDLGSALNLLNGMDPQTLTKKIQQNLNISIVVSHSPKLATLATDQTETAILNAYSSEPHFTTSAGDHFNAGIGYGLLLDFPKEILPLIGNGVTSFFVREGRSPNVSELRTFLSNYQNYLMK